MATRSWNLFLVLLILALCQGCSGSSANDPIHLHLVCLDGADGGVACKESERLLACDAWIAEALVRPHSTLTIWRAGPDRQHYSPFFTACIPTSWGPGAMEAKDFFIRGAREGAKAGGAAFPKGCAPPGPGTPGVHRLQVSKTTTPISPGVWQALASRSAGSPPLHMGIVCDRSGSTGGGACNEAGLTGAFDLWAAESLAATGSLLSVYQVGSSLDTVRALYRLSVPERSVGEKAAFIISARNELSRLLADTAEENGSAVAESISIAAAEVHERGGRHRIVLLSDMRQVSAGSWDFERSIPTAQQFVGWLRRENLLADLHDVPVLVYGIHNRHTNAGHMAQIRDTWEGALRVMGAPKIEMYTTVEAAFASR